MCRMIVASVENVRSIDPETSIGHVLTRVLESSIVLETTTIPGHTVGRVTSSGLEITTGLEGCRNTHEICRVDVTSAVLPHTVTGLIHEIALLMPRTRE